jgi:hypothetical protein
LWFPAQDLFREKSAMRQEQSYKGWLAVLTATTTLTLVLMVVEKYLARPGEDFWAVARRVTDRVRGNDTGISLEIDVGLIGTSPVDPNSTFTMQRRQDSTSGSIDWLRRPPELAASAWLREPLTSEDFVVLPLSQRSSNLNTLLHQMDQAFETPIATVSASSARIDSGAPGIDGGLASQRRESLKTPAEAAGKMPSPIQLISELETLRSGLSSFDQADEHLVSRTEVEQQQPHRLTSRHTLDSAQIYTIDTWLVSIQTHLDRLVQNVGLENDSSQDLLRQLETLGQQGRQLGDELVDHDLAAKIIRTSYSLQRRVAVWTAIQNCLDKTSIGLTQPNKGPLSTKSQILTAVKEVEDYVQSISDRAGWRSYLLLDDLSRWATSEQEQWRAGNQLARSYLSRIYWARLDKQQQELINHEAVSELGELLSGWSRDPIDYRHLLASIEQIEFDAESRLTYAVADTIQILRHAKNDQQKQLAEVLNTHYRNANLRLTISDKLIKRFLPEQKYEIRPVRQRILGADTAGDSAVQTELAIKFHPDPAAWNVELGVSGNMVSSTQSSRGPVVFHNTGEAQVNSTRFIKLNPAGAQVMSQPAQVNSTDQLQQMKTDFDGLPIVGDFVRLIVREQFNQKRGLARRITERIIANETDAEIDRKLAQSMQEAEAELNRRILGPLQRLTLDPMVVSMSTSADRLMVRYRLAHEMQLSAHTPRPRAPTESLTSFQLHESTINNTLDKLGLAGKDWRLHELYQNLGKVFRADWTPPEDLPNDISIRFADHRPIAIEMVDERIRLHLRIANFTRDEGVNISNFTVTSTYIPVANGLTAGLIRDPDGTTEIKARHLPVRDRLALRVIFSKVFVSQPEVSLISGEWSSDPRAKDLAVSQLEVRDGWLAVAISDSSSQLAQEVAQRSQHTKNLVR